MMTAVTVLSSPLDLPGVIRLTSALARLLNAPTAMTAVEDASALIQTLRGALPLKDVYLFLLAARTMMDAEDACQ